MYDLTTYNNNYDEFQSQAIKYEDNIKEITKEEKNYYKYFDHLRHRDGVINASCAQYKNLRLKLIEISTIETKFDFFIQLIKEINCKYVLKNLFNSCIANKQSSQNSEYYLSNSIENLINTLASTLSTTQINTFITKYIKSNNSINKSSMNKIKKSANISEKFNIILEEIINYKNKLITDRLRSWILGTKMKRDTIFKYAIALFNDGKELNEFLVDTCKYSGVNVKNYVESTIYFCLNNNISVYECIFLICCYENQILFDNNCSQTKYDLTTKHLILELQNNTQISPSEFYQSFLLKNNDKFSGFSRNTMIIYLTNKNILKLVYFLDKLNDEIFIEANSAKITNFIELLGELLKSKNLCNLMSNEIRHFSDQTDIKQIIFQLIEYMEIISVYQNICLYYPLLETTYRGANILDVKAIMLEVFTSSQEILNQIINRNNINSNGTRYFDRIIYWTKQQYPSTELSDNEISDFQADMKELFDGAIEDINNKLEEILPIYSTNIHNESSNQINLDLNTIIKDLSYVDSLINILISNRAVWNEVYCWFPTRENNPHQIQNIGRSTLKDTIINDLPKPNTFDDFDNSVLLNNYKIYNSDMMRKTIIMCIFALFSSIFNNNTDEDIEFDKWLCTKLGCTMITTSLSEFDNNDKFNRLIMSSAIYYKLGIKSSFDSFFNEIIEESYS